MSLLLLLCLPFMGSAVAALLAAAVGWSASRRVLRPLSRVATAASDLARWLLGSPATAYATVFALAPGETAPNERPARCAGRRTAPVGFRPTKDRLGSAGCSHHLGLPVFRSMQG